MLTWARESAVCVSLACVAFTMVSCRGDEENDIPTPIAATEQPNIQPKIESPNIGGETEPSGISEASLDIKVTGIEESRIDKACLASLVVDFKKFVDDEKLEPYKVKVFADHPKVKEILSEPCLRLRYADTDYAIALKSNGRDVIAVTDSSSHKQYAYLTLKSDYVLNTANCIIK